MNRKPVRILLMGDSTVWGSVPRLMAPESEPLERVLTRLLASEPGLPPVEALNRGQDNDTIQRLLSDRYATDIVGLPEAPDFIFIRYGINDCYYLAHFPEDYLKTYHELIARLRKDYPLARIILETIIPYHGDPAKTDEVNTCIRQIAKEEGLSVCDTHAVYAAAIQDDPDRLCYRKIAMAAIPENLRGRIPLKAIMGDDVFILDTSLDGRLGHLPGWTDDRYPNPEGYQVIGRGLAAFLKTLAECLTKDC
ncbi:MAG: SGNH/GDSL hydrolase family protein [Lentisphaerae bacterium]|nr:SGNH/GDSL hydrolase family protein [Lentisphaerota bacterium]